MNQVTFCPELAAATGTFDFPMTNDYMFRAVLQANQKALTGLISSLLHLPLSKISSVKIINPIILGNNCNDKEFRLDINIILNNHCIINLEMQVLFYSNWTSRSLVYLCRNFDSLSRGENYSELKSVVHIGILDHSLFPNNPEFYAHNMLMNTKTHKIYSDKITLNVLDLTQIQLATQEDKNWKIDYWAKLFKATTWEELKMIAKNNEYLTEASNTIFTMNADEQVRKRCLDREEYYRDIRDFKEQIAEKDKIIVSLQAEIERLKAEQNH